MAVVSNFFLLFLHHNHTPALSDIFSPHFYSYLHQLTNDEQNWYEHN